jgi:diaminohydroxyphosphoribosylaminopyrimidine deaminase/5-amino-6-(5-phosphoribosylamino)uracil reductase
MPFTPAESAAMQRALALARRGEGWVEPNPMVGAVVLAADGLPIGEGWHKRFGGDHAEVMALAAAGERARGGTLVVTLEPCAHHGKTPPCVDAILAAGLARVVIAAPDPSPHAAGSGVVGLRAAGVEVEAGLFGAEAIRLTRPFRCLVERRRPWTIAKWALSLDGRIATASGESRWISSEASRRLVHQLRGRVDAVMVGIGTALADDPLLTARPPGPRRALRIVCDTAARLPPDSQLVRTARDRPVLVAAAADAPCERLRALESAGCEIVVCPGATAEDRLAWLLESLGGRRITNLLVEGGPTLLGTCFDGDFVDEVWAFIAAKVIGGAAAPAAVGGAGVAGIALARSIEVEETRFAGGDVLVRGLVRRPSSENPPEARRSDERLGVK